MSDILYFLSLIGGIAVWYWIAKKMKLSGKGAVLRHLVGMFAGFVTLLIVATVAIQLDPKAKQEIAKQNAEAKASQKPETQATSQTQNNAAAKPVDPTKASTADGTLTAKVMMEKEKVPHEFNDKGIVIFTNARDMFNVFNDYPEDGGQLKILSEKPLKIRISDLATANDGADNLALSKKKAFMYGVYNVFMHTKENSVTVESIPVDLKTGKPIKTTALQGTISREHALEVLKKYSSAQSFDDLVETKPNDQYRVIGMSSSKVYDEFAYGLKNQDAIISALLK